jgi:hypothetical protein
MSRMSFFARELGNSAQARDFSAANYLEKGTWRLAAL